MTLRAYLVDYFCVVAATALATVVLAIELPLELRAAGASVLFVIVPGRIIPIFRPAESRN